MTTPFPVAVLGLTYEILVNGTWTAITDFVQQSADTSLTVPRQDETTQATFGQATFTVINTDGRFSPDNPNGAYAPYIARNVQCRISVSATSATGDSYSGYRFWGEVTSWIPQQDSSGNYQYCAVTVCGVLRRYNQGAKIGSPMDRYYRQLATTSLAPYGAWPAEDGSQATELGSIVNGVPAMAITGSPNLATDASFGGSDPIPVINSSTWHGQTQAAETPPGVGSLTEFTPGTYTWTCPPGVTSVQVSGVGSGGGGGWAASTDIRGGGGGGGGESAADTLDVTPGVTYTYVVPAGGSAGTQLAPALPGSAATFAGDTTDLIAEGGALGGSVLEGSYGGAGGSGSTNTTHYPGGDGAAGEVSATATYNQTIYGKAGGTGGGDNVRAGTVTASWTCPSGTSAVDVHALAGGGGGGQGDGISGGGNGGGGGSFAQGSVNVTPGVTYTPYAGSGGAGGSGAGHGNPGGNSGFTGDSSSAVEAGGGGGGNAGGGDGEAGGVLQGSGNSGGAGGDSANSTAADGGGGGGGGGAADASRAGTDGTAASGRTPGSGGATGGYGRILTGSGQGGQTAGGTGLGYGSGGGGGGSTSNSFNGLGTNGGGGAPGSLGWSWTNDGPTGGGGGASGGTSAAGTAGNGNGQGGAAVTGGGAGGSMNMPGTTPGGGGGGADPATGTPGAGAPGQISFSWNGGGMSPVPADIIRFLLHIDALGAAEGAVLARAVTFGTIQTIDVIYHTANSGSLEVKGYTGSTVYFDQTGCFTDLNGTPVCVSVSLTAGSGG